MPGSFSAGQVFAIAIAASRSSTSMIGEPADDLLGLDERAVDHDRLAAVAALTVVAVVTGCSSAPPSTMRPASSACRTR